jgi:hypothetical protein
VTAFFFLNQRRQQLFFSTHFSSAAVLLQLETKKENEGIEEQVRNFS